MNKYSNEQVLYFISLIRGDVSNINKITKKPYETTKEINQIIFTKGDCLFQSFRWKAMRKSFLEWEMLYLILIYME